MRTSRGDRPRDHHPFGGPGSEQSNRDPGLSSHSVRRGAPVRPRPVSARCARDTRPSRTMREPGRGRTTIPLYRPDRPMREGAVWASRSRPDSTLGEDGRQFARESRPDVLPLTVGDVIAERAQNSLRQQGYIGAFRPRGSFRSAIGCLMAITSRSRNRWSRHEPSRRPGARGLPCRCELGQPIRACRIQACSGDGCERAV
jgi:hypothetical protein